MSDLSFVLNNLDNIPYLLQLAQFKLMHMDKDTLVTLAYPCWLYLMTEVAVSGGSRRRSYSRHHH